mmetsp:Transcript_27100/g.68293  ORF Transcript_27100/g.68293 Transcript_27100/m.68293 type:complete len:116 (-) Transcript_27100:55-402(-)
MGGVQARGRRPKGSGLDGGMGLALADDADGEGADEATDRVAPLFRKAVWWGSPNSLPKAPAEGGGQRAGFLGEDASAEGEAELVAPTPPPRPGRRVGMYRKAVARRLSKGDTVMM